MAIIHIITPDEPSSKTDMSGILSKMLTDLGHTTSVRTNSDVDYQAAGPGDAAEGDAHIQAPHAVIIDATIDAKAALATAKKFKGIVDRVIVLGPGNNDINFAGMFTDRDVGAMPPIPVSAATDRTAEVICNTVANTLRIGQSRDAFEDEFMPILDAEGNKVGSLDTTTWTLIGPKGEAGARRVSQQEGHYLRLMLLKREFVYRRDVLVALASQRGGDVKTPDVVVCRLRAALDEVGLNGASGDAGMIATARGEGYKFVPANAVAPTQRLARRAGKRHAAVTGPDRALPVVAADKPGDDPV